MTFLPKNEILTFEEIERLCDNFIEMGVKKIRLTGGEPLIRKDILYLIKQLNLKKNKTNLKEITLTTNGTLLEKYAKDLIVNGINRINLSLDTINPNKYKNLLQNKSLGMIFEKQSNRTRLSFDIGMKKIGGNVIELDKKGIGFGKRESNSDMINVLSQYIDCLIISKNKLIDT